MSRILKVSIFYNDKILFLEGEEAEKWERHNIAVAHLAQNHGMNPFEKDPIKWTILGSKDMEINHE